MTLELAMLIGNALVKYGPDAARALRTLFSKKEITNADWDAVFSTCELTYEEKMAQKP